MLIRLLFLAAFGFTTIASAAADAQTRTRRSAPSQRSSPRAQFEAALVRSEAGPMFAAMRRNFPVETGAFIDRLFNLVMANRNNQAAYQRAAMREHMLFLRNMVPHLQRAPEAELMRAVRARLALFEAVQRIDTGMCGRLAAHGNVDARLPDAIRRANSTAMIAIIDAAGAGRRTPAPPAGQVTDAENEVLARTFRETDPAGDLLPLAAGELQVAAVAPERACRYAIAVQRATLALPPGLAGKMAVDLLQNALGVGMTPPE